MCHSGRKCTRTPRSRYCSKQDPTMTEPAPIRFNLRAAAAGCKRAVETSTAQKPKVPRVSDMKIIERTTMTCPSTTAPVNICIYKITDGWGENGR